MPWQKVDDQQPVDQVNLGIQAGALEGIATKLRSEIEKAREIGGPAHSDDYIAGLETAAAQAEWDAAELRRRIEREDG
ncbi:hypothetical protein BJH93_04010 [Kocuria polaris]|nr:hypothetical protein [Kocuria polaris]